MKCHGTIKNIEFVIRFCKVRFCLNIIYQSILDIQGLVWCAKALYVAVLLSKIQFINEPGCILYQVRVAYTEAVKTLCRVTEKVFLYPFANCEISQLLFSLDWFYSFFAMDNETWHIYTFWVTWRQQGIWGPGTYTVHLHRVLDLTIFYY